MEVVDAPTERYDDIGGLDQQVLEIQESVELPLKKPELFKRIGIEPPKGVLLYGPPGTGKTLLAKTIAHEIDATFFSSSAPSPGAEQVGGRGRTEHPQAVRGGQEAEPQAIIFIDEIEALRSPRPADGQFVGHAAGGPPQDPAGTWGARRAQP